MDLPEGQVHLRLAPGSAPAIVFLHQTASASSSFEPVMQSLRVANRLIAIDTPGFGGSFEPPGWPSVARYAGYMAAVLDRLGVGRFHVFGHHTGGTIALELARRLPQRVRSVMILGPVTMTVAERRAFRATFEKPIAPRADGAHLLENWNYAHHYNPRCDLEIVHSEVVNMLRAWRGRAQAYRAVSFHDDLAAIRGLRVPLLLLSSPEDYFFPTFAQVCAARPDAATGIVGGENFPTLADSSGVARSIEAFLGAGTAKSQALRRPRLAAKSRQAGRRRSVRPRGRDAG